MTIAFRSNNPAKNSFVRPETILTALEPVIGQSELKNKLAAVGSQYTHFRLDPAVGRPLVLVLGPSGTGKTMAVELMGKFLGLPYTSVSAASMSMTSYKGLTFRDLLVQHITEFKSDEGIIFVDEIDKWCRGAIGIDPETIAQGNRMQAEALRMMTSEKAVLADEMEMEEGDTEKDITFNTGRTMWVLAGAFVGVERLVKLRLHGHHNIPDDELWSEVVPSDLIRYGMLTELVGRMQSIAWVNPLTSMQMIEILERQEVPKWKLMFKMIGCELSLHRGALSTCVDRAKEESTGVRGAVTFLRRGMEDIYTEASKNHVERLEVTRIFIETGRIDLEVKVAS